MNIKCNALITASTKGIGFQAAEALAENGCNLIINARDENELAEKVDELRRKYGTKVFGIKADLSKRNDVKRLFMNSIKKLKSIDVFVMNYGNPLCEPCNLIDTNYEDWLYSFNMYVYSTAEMMNLSYKYNVKKANFIVISSFSTYSPMESTSLSDIIRGSLIPLIKAYSRFYSNKIRANALILGSFKTEGAQSLIKKLSEKIKISEDEFWDKYIKPLSPLNRLGEFKELKSIISFLAFSPEYLTGSTIIFDGGSLSCVI